MAPPLTAATLTGAAAAADAEEATIGASSESFEHGATAASTAAAGTATAAEGILAENNLATGLAVGAVVLVASKETGIEEAGFSFLEGGDDLLGRDEGESFGERAGAS